MPQIEDKIDEILKLTQQNTNDIAHIKRGLYGDPVNKLPGLIDRQIEDEAEIKKLKDQQSRTLWIVTGFGAAVSVIFNFLKELFWK